ncbi:MAG TPA: gliding motility-associated C-terminal domain-containing protein [Cyclobacteriaceae bacterium]|nr:gliding motility-associated C-terminal domain-containing protein [Cyclobacteriaceae bacterium]
MSIFHTRLSATHIRAGEILAQIIDCNSLRYRIAFVEYTDLGSTVCPGGGEMDFGDGSEPVRFTPCQPDYYEDLGDLVALNIFYVEHTFPGPGIYVIRYLEANRNDGIANMDNSVNTKFYVESQIYIDPFLKCNNSPKLLNPPLDRACVGKAFYHNPAAFDPDGDSLSYEITINKQDIDYPVANYQFPNVYDLGAYPGATTEDGLGPPTYTLDVVSGDLIWDAPGGEGEYNIAFLIKEWRFVPELGEWVKMGYVTRDMQILVEECENDKPELTIPNDTCVRAGTLLEADFTAIDPDGDDVTISAFGGPFELPSSPASYSPSPDNPQQSPAVTHFTWQTNCDHVRDRAYQITVKAKDSPPKEKGASLVDFKNWFITVVAPEPEGLTITYQAGRKVILNWDDYECRDNAESMQIWRRVDSYPFEPGPCDVGMPYYAGYELIGRTTIDQTEFTDNNSGGGLEYGATYCYRIVAEFPLPNGGESYVSDEVCVTIEEDHQRFGPVITKVSITETDMENGVVELQWTSPFDADPAVYPPPYTYRLYRGENGNKDPDDAVPFDVNDTVYTDTGLNTRDYIYNYFVEAFDVNGSVVDSSAWASTVRLNTEPEVSIIGLVWNADVPWSNNTAGYPYHYIYRNRASDADTAEFILIDSVNVNLAGFNYLDSGQFNQVPLIQTQVYCYYVTTQGSYGNPKVIEPLVNNSQKICSQPNDTVPPCIIEGSSIQINKDIDCRTFISDKPCTYDSYEHLVEWEYAESDTCEDDINSYEIWFSATGDEDDFSKIASVSIKSYTHSGLKSFAGCYKIRPIDRSGNIGEFSEKVCYENCPQYELPNVFTPNNDGFNDMFQAFSFPYDKCPRFVKSVDFRVYSRWGEEIFRTGKDEETSIYINWDGRTSNGTILASGVYYYVAEVEYINVDDALTNQEIKGWVQILR